MFSKYTIFDKYVTPSLLNQFLPKQGSVDQISAIMQLKSVDLSFQKLTSMQGLDMCTDLVQANLSSNIITKIDVLTLELLTELKQLNLSHNKIEEFPNLSQLRITDLNIAFNPLELNPDFLPKTLQRISISGIDIQRVAIRQLLPNIEFYETQVLEITEIINETEQAIQSDLITSAQEIHDIANLDPAQRKPAQVNLNQSVKIIKAQTAAKGAESPSLAAYHRLEILLKPQLSATGREAHIQIMNLKTVKLANIGMTAVEGLDLCEKCESLDLSNNQLTTIDAQTLELMSLKVLNLQSNLINEIPDLSLTKIVDLNISYNPIGKISVEKLPETLLKISITGIQQLNVIEKLIKDKFPSITFYESRQSKVAKAAAIDQKPGSSRSQGRQLAPMSARNNKTPVVKSNVCQPPKVGATPAKKEGTGMLSSVLGSIKEEVVVTDKQREIMQQEAKMQRSEQILAEKYKKALDEIEQIRYEQFGERMNEIIQGSGDRARNQQQQILGQGRQQIMEFEEEQEMLRLADAETKKQLFLTQNGKPE